MSFAHAKCVQGLVEFRKDVGEELHRLAAERARSTAAQSHETERGEPTYRTHQSSKRAKAELFLWLVNRLLHHQVLWSIGESLLVRLMNQV